MESDAAFIRSIAALIQIGELNSEVQPVAGTAISRKLKHALPSGEDASAGAGVLWLPPANCGTERYEEAHREKTRQMDHSPAGDPASRSLAGNPSLWTTETG